MLNHTFKRITAAATSMAMAAIVIQYFPQKQRSYAESLTGEVTFADGMTELPQNVCLAAKHVSKVNIPDSVTSFGSGAFSETELPVS